MSNAIATITYADVGGFPVGSVVDHIDVTVTDQNGVVTRQDVAGGTPSVTFANLADGSYTFAVQAFNATGTGLGTALTGTFSLSSPQTISLSLPATAAFTQQ